HLCGSTEEEVLSVDLLAPSGKLRRLGAPVLDAHDNRAWASDPRWAMVRRTVVAMDPPDSLQQQIDRRKVCDEEVEFDVERLLHHLCAHHDETLWAIATGTVLMGRAERLDDPAFLGLAVRCEESRMQQGDVLPEDRRELLICLLRAADGVANHQRAPAVGQSFCQDGCDLAVVGDLEPYAGRARGRRYGDDGRLLALDVCQLRRR